MEHLRGSMDRILSMEDSPNMEHHQDNMDKTLNMEAKLLHNNSALRLRMCHIHRPYRLAGLRSGILLDSAGHIWMQIAKSSGPCLLILRTQMLMAEMEVAG